MSELSLINWTGKKGAESNSVPKGTLVFAYIKGDKDLVETNASNEFFIKRQIGLDEEEQAFEDTQGYLDGIGKKNDNSITTKRINEIIQINKDITEFILNNLHRLYWRDYSKGIISTIDPNKALQLIIPAATEFRKVLVQSVDKKYRKDLTVASVKNTIESHDLETKQSLGKNLNSIKKNN
jgi:hypothetical protein